MFFYGSTTLVDLVLSSAEVSRSHTAIPHSVGILQTSDRPVAESYTCDHKTHTRDGHPFAGGIRTRNPNKRAAADRRLRPCGHRIGIYMPIYLNIHGEGSCGLVIIVRNFRNTVFVCSVDHCCTLNTKVTI